MCAWKWYIISGEKWAKAVLFFCFFFPQSQIIGQFAGFNAGLPWEVADDACPGIESKAEIYRIYRSRSATKFPRL